MSKIVSIVDSFMSWWENTHPFIGLIVLLVLALPLGFLQWLYYRRLEKETE